MVSEDQNTPERSRGLTAPLGLLGRLSSLKVKGMGWGSPLRAYSLGSSEVLTSKCCVWVLK